ncbi:MAG: BolA family protein [Formosimonas sp.]|jgi:BolA protein
MMDLAQTLHERLTASLQPTELEIINESHLHAGHAGAAGGAQHFAVRIVSTQFAGITRMAQHRLVYAAVADLMPHPIHALRIDAKGA